MGKRKEQERPEPDYAEVRAEKIAEMIGLGFSDEEAAAEARLTEARMKARLEHGFSLLDRLWAANEAVTAAWDRYLDAHPEYCIGGEKEHEDCGFEPVEEQKALDAIQAEVDAVMQHGRWPRDLHFRGV